MVQVRNLLEVYMYDHSTRTVWQNGVWRYLYFTQLSHGLSRDTVHTRMNFQFTITNLKINKYQQVFFFRKYGITSTYYHDIHTVVSIRLKYKCSSILRFIILMWVPSMQEIVASPTFFILNHFQLDPLSANAPLHDLDYLSQNFWYCTSTKAYI